MMGCDVVDWSSGQLILMTWHSVWVFSQPLNQQIYMKCLHFEFQFSSTLNLELFLFIG